MGHPPVQKVSSELHIALYLTDLPTEIQVALFYRQTRIESRR